jgi:DNA-binding NtrC family response regulator
MLGAEEAAVLSQFGARTMIPPFVFTTGFRDRDLQVKAKQFGALAVLDKPIDIDELRQIVNTYLHPLTEDRDRFGIVCVPAFVSLRARL